MDQFEQTNEVQDEESYVADEEESDTIDDQSSDQSSSGDDDYDSDDDDDIAADVRDLMKRDKVVVLAEVIKCRTEQLRLRQQLKVYQYALEEMGGQKTKLQLDLALTTKTLLVLQEGFSEQHLQDEKILKQINMMSDFLGDLDMKRVQLIKETRQLAAQLTSDKEKIEAMVKERTQEETNRCRQLQEQINAMAVTNNDLEQQLVEADIAYQSLTSAHSERSNELAKLTEELQEVQKRIAIEVQSNTTLKANVDMLLAEKTQLATEIIQLENRVAELEEEKKVKLAQMERSTNSKLLKLEQQKDAKLTELDNAWKGKYEEEMMKVDAKITALKTDNEDANKQNAILHTTIEKLREELCALNKQLEQEKEQEKKMDSKIGHVKTMLEDRNNEICSLNTKLNNEQKRLEEQNRQFEQKFAELEGKLKNIQDEADKKAKDLEGQLLRAQGEADKNKTENEKLVQDLANHASKISALELTILEKDQQQMALKEKLADAEKAQASLEVPPKAYRQDNNQSSATQITSTPLRPSNLVDSLDIPSSKRTRMSESDLLSVHSSISNYTSFQGSVDRKRDMSRFFMRKSPTQAKTKPAPKTFFGKTSRSNSEDDLISLNSTVNLDEEPLETLNITNSGSPIPMVKPFFRRQAEKK
ncbi:myosin-9-like [Ochlerotatus camptorhynchus]|uniref:myosin-9-like n=1 Tax=Ochlerotatus camptorhynchus TaxID=644619 RepID=UPI0031DAB299